MKRVFIWLSVLNSPAIAMSVVYCVHVIWFAKYQQRNVGPSVTYAAYALLAFAFSQLSNLALWIAWRRKPEARRLLSRVAIYVFAFTFACFWVGDQFRYVGERYALTHSLWSAIRMKDPPMFTPAASEQPIVIEPVPGVRPCQKSCR